MESTSRQLVPERHSNLPYAGMRVVLDARKLTHGGIGVYIQNLVAGFLEQGVDLTLLGSELEVGQFSWKDRVRVLDEISRPYSIHALFSLSRRFDLRKFDIFHEPHYTLPYSVPIPKIVTIHDLIHIRFPEKRYYPILARQLIKSAVNRADSVIAVSQSTANDLKELLGKKSEQNEKIQIIPNAIDPRFFRSTSSSEFVKGRFGLKGRFFLAVSSMLKPHKGVVDLIRAYQSFREIRQKLDIPDCKLVLVGKGTERLVDVERLMNEVGETKGLRLVGAVSSEELFHLYGAAVALVVPSRSEGFCLPVIEAQARGTPVISRPVPAIQELLISSDMVCSDFEPESMAHSLVQFMQRYKKELLSGQMPRNNHDERHAHLERFDRESVSCRVLELYQRTIEKKKD